MLKVGLTGGIAVGKSTVGAMLAVRGAHLLQADELAHHLMEPGQSVYEEVIRHFGPDVLDPDGSVNRARLAEAAFGLGASARIEELNQIVHPAVLQQQEAWMDSIGRRDPHAIAIVEAALILEAHALSQFDRLVVVTCDVEQRIRRWARHRNVDFEIARREVTRRMAAQLPDEEKIKAAHCVIDNSGSLEDTEKQVERVFTALRADEAEIGSGL
jgi:dephospho-CoA kinase